MAAAALRKSDSMLYNLQIGSQLRLPLACLVKSQIEEYMAVYWTKVRV